MNPPTEQLIRDYLNRLSLAARGRLGFADRQSLLDRTRNRIDAECGGVNSASPAHVRKALASLGDPIAVVELEQARVKEQRVKEQQIGGDLLVAGGSDEQPRAAAGGSRWPVADDPAMSAFHPEPYAASEPYATAELLAAPEQDDDRVPDERGTPSSRRYRAATTTGVGVADRLATRSITMVRRHPLEVIAVVLLGLGGASYPPVWLLGAALALLSKKWDVRDKFLGLVLPVLVVVIGTVLALVFGGPRGSMSGYAYETWLAAGRLSRVAAFAGAAYLLWPLRRGRRRPRQPPWNVPHRLG